jgi:alpha-1,2-rhamnosyltransferase
MFEGVEAQQMRSISMNDGPGRQHFSVEPGVTRQKPMEIPAVSVGPVHHRRDGKAYVGGAHVEKLSGACGRGRGNAPLRRHGQDGLATVLNVPYHASGRKSGAVGYEMTSKDEINAWLRTALECEQGRNPVVIRYLAARARELYWTISAFIGLSRLHDGQWRAPPPHVAENMRPMLAEDIPPPSARGRLLIDVTATHRYGKQSGVQRVVREIALASVRDGDALPVFIAGGRLFSHFRHPNLPDAIEPGVGDILLLLDSGWGFWPEYPPLMTAARAAGARIVGCVYDLIPLDYPDATESGNRKGFEQWFAHVLMHCDALVCISKSVADDLVDRLRDSGLQPPPHFRIGYWPLGADFRFQIAAHPSKRVKALLDDPSPFFLSVGTVEPRKAYPVALDAFERLWAEESDCRYVIVGRPGWNTGVLQARLKGHKAAGRRLFWFDDADDAELAALYGRARALVFPSVAEGYGMPLVEARARGVPAIASDIPVFREVGGAGAIYFPVLDSLALAEALRRALQSLEPPEQPEVTSWRESAARLAALVKSDLYQMDEDKLAGRFSRRSDVAT